MTDEIQSTIDSIRTLAVDIDGKKQSIKVLQEQIKEVVERIPEYQEVVALTESLAQAKEALRLILLGNQQYNDLMERLGRFKEDLADDSDVLSEHIVFYHAQTKEVQIEIDPNNGDARALVVNGKLGKSSKYQPSLFNGATVTISDGNSQLTIDGDLKLD